MKKILIAVDFSDVTGKVVNEGVKFAKAFNAEVCLMHTEPPDEGYIYYDAGYSSMGAFGYVNELDPDIEESYQHKIEGDTHALTALKKRVEDMGINAVTHLIEGDVPKQIIQHALEYEADMVVIGNHRHGKLYKFLFNDVGTHLMNKTTCPVLVVPSDSK